MNAMLFYATLALYLGATVSYLFYLYKPSEALGKTARFIIIAGFVVHIIFTVDRYIEAGHTPITNLHESLSFFSMAVVGVFLYFERRFKMLVLGSFVTPVALVLMAVSA